MKGTALRWTLRVCHLPRVPTRLTHSSSQGGRVRVRVASLCFALLSACLVLKLGDMGRGESVMVLDNQLPAALPRSGN